MHRIQDHICRCCYYNVLWAGGVRMCVLVCLHAATLSKPSFCRSHACASFAFRRPLRSFFFFFSFLVSLCFLRRPSFLAPSPMAIKSKQNTKQQPITRNSACGVPTFFFFEIYTWSPVYSYCHTTL